MTSKVIIYGKTKQGFYKVAEDYLDKIWDFKFDDDKLKYVDFVEQNGSNYKLEEDEIFFIKSKDEDIGEYLDNMINTVNCNSITKEALKQIETLYFFNKIEDKFNLYIQRIMPSARVEKTLLSFRPDMNLAHIERNKVIIPILNYTHIYWNQKQQKIYFKRFSDLESVFPNFSKYYREANEEDLKIFKDKNKYPFLDVKISDLKKLSKTKLKIIAMIVDELDKVKENIGEYMEYAKKYKIEFIIDDKFEINDMNDIDSLSDIIFRKIYTTEAGEKEIRKANSFKIINPN